MLYSELQCSPAIHQAVERMGFAEMTEIQEKTIPVMMAGHDVIAKAPTGTGKTCAFGIPVAEHILPENKYPQAVIMAPTRELAMQITDEMRDIAVCHEGVRLVCLYGGQPIGKQIDALKRRPQIVVATPGRLSDHMKRRTVSLKSVSTVVLDEADRMLDMGFIHDIRRILKLLPAKRQTLFFSATMPPEIETLANSMLTHPEKVEVTPASSTVDTISQSVYFVEKKEKKDLLIHLLKNPAIKSVLIFTRTKYGADKLARTLSKSGIRAEAIHGNKSQNARQRALTGFKNHELRVLIATDIAARGIDVDQLSHVINYELPNIPETYVHRIGRTGRAGHDGIALSFCESEELPYLKDIQKLIGKSIPVIKEHPFVTADGLKAQKIKTEEIKAKTKENKIYRGSRTNGDFWRRKKQTSQNNTPKGVGR